MTTDWVPVRDDNGRPWLQQAGAVRARRTCWPIWHAYRLLNRRCSR